MIFYLNSLHTTSPASRGRTLKEKIPMMKFLTKRTRNKKGFTLIELIVVLAILGVILAIAVPRYVGLQEQAQIKADRATAALIISAARLAEVNEDKTEGTVSLSTDLVGEYIDDPGTGFTLSFSGGKYRVAYGRDGSPYIEGQPINTWTTAGEDTTTED